MKNISLDCLPLSLFVGYAGENDARGLAFDYSSWTEEYGAGVLQMLLQRPGDANPYPVLLSAGEDGTAVWLPSAIDTDVKGKGEIQLIYTVDQVIAKTAVLPVLIERSLGAGTTPPDPYETWVEELLEIGNKILQDYQAPKIINGYWYEFDADLGEYVNTGVKAEGQDGVGISSAVLNADYTLTLTFSDGTSYTTPSIRGEQGETGATPALSIGTVTTLPAGSPATAEMTGTPEAPVLNLGIPQGAKGDPGEVTLADLLKAFPQDNASGAIASFMDGSDGLPFRSLVVNIEPIQDLRGYDSPWPSGGGVNKLLPSDIDDTKTVQDVTATWKADTEELTLNGANSGSYALVIDFRDSNGHIKFPDLQTGDTWTLAANLPTGAYIGVVYKNTSNTDVQYWYILGDGTFKKDTRSVPNDFVSFQRVQIGMNPGAAFSNAKCHFAFASGSTITSWTPYSNLCPISGRTGAKVTRTGRNLFDKAAITPNSWIVVNSTEIGPANSFFVSDYIPVIAGKKIACTSRGASRCAYYDKWKNPISYVSWSGGALTPLYDGYIRITDTNDHLDTLQVEFGTSVTDYEASQADTYSITFPTSAGTVYGCTLNVTTGVLTVEYVKKTITSFGGAWGIQPSGNYAVYAALSDTTHIQTDMKISMMKSNIFKYTSNGRDNAPLYGYGGNDGGETTQTFILPSTITSLAEANAWLADNPTECTFKLATPLVYDLDPVTVSTLLGTNNIFADCGDTAVDYYADPTLYINKKLAAAIAAMS